MLIKQIVLQESALSTDCTHCDHQCHHRHLSCFSMQSTVTPQIPAFVPYHGRQCYQVTIVNPGTIVTMAIACVTPTTLPEIVNKISKFLSNCSYACELNRVFTFLLFHTVDKRGFRKLVSRLDPQYTRFSQNNYTMKSGMVVCNQP